MPQSYDFGPLFGSTVGFDGVFDLLQSATRGQQEADRYPPYDIERTGENAFRITLAVAGFKEDELAITAERNLLFVEGERRDTEAPGAERELLYRGIGARPFKQRFQLADHVKVTSASLMDGLLTIELVREIPEVLRPRRIEVERKVLLDCAGVPGGVDLAWQPKHFLGAPVPGATIATLNLAQVVLAIEFTAAEIAETETMAEKPIADAVALDLPVVVDPVIANERVV